MFDQTRKKIAASVLVLLLIFLTVILSSLYLSNYFSLKKQNEEMLERYVSIYSLDALPGEDPPEEIAEEFGNVFRAETGGEVVLKEDDFFEPEQGMEMSPDAMEGRPPVLGKEPSEEEDGNLYLLASFYSVSFGEDDEILAVDTGRTILYSREEILSFAASIRKQEKEKGVLKGLMYRVEKREDYTLIAFLDTTVTDDSMNKLLLHTLLTGGISVLLLFIAAIMLALLIVKPLEENDRNQRKFVSDAEHELKTPIAVIGANAELLEKEMGKNEWLSNIRYENDRMGRLVAELLSLSRVEDVSELRRENEKEIIDLFHLTEQEVLPFESVAFEEGLMIELRLPGRVVAEDEAGEDTVPVFDRDAVPVFDRDAVERKKEEKKSLEKEEEIRIRGNRKELSQLIGILTDNAIRYGAGGDRVEITLKKEGKTALLTVKNRGEEIPEEYRERLFDRFFRMDEARTAEHGAERDSGGNYGLGLPIAKAIVLKHHGTIEVNCPEGYVVFTVCLPLE